jgi:rRNA-processing protein FCF1
MSVEGALDMISDLTQRAGSLHRSPGDPSELQQNYLIWVEDAEHQLDAWFESPSVWQELLTERYWSIRGRLGPRLDPLIEAERSWQTQRLKGIAADLKREHEAFALPAGCVAVVPDTNVLLHRQRFDYIPWPEVLGASAVRLVIPLIVLEQLDRQTYRAEGNVPERAKGVIAHIRSSWDVNGALKPESPAEVRDGVTLQALTDPPGHQRRGNEDDEILDRVEHLVTVATGRVVVATLDIGMEVRAATRGLENITVPDKYA